MPELPDVEIFRQYCQATALHQKIEEVRVRDASILEGISAGRLQEKLTGRAFDSADRHGKRLFAEAERGWLVLHFGMSGFLAYYKNPQEAPDHVPRELKFAGGHRLAYDCSRKLGKIGWTDEREHFIADKGLGPDPLGGDFEAAFFEHGQKGGEQPGAPSQQGRRKPHPARRAGFR